MRNNQVHKPAKSFKATIIRHLREWHRKLGIFAAVFLIFLSVTGIGLNHTDSLALAHQPITNQWLLEHYGIKNPANVSYFHQKKTSITDQYIWLGDKLLAETSDKIIAIGQYQAFWLVVTTAELSIYNKSGVLVDQLNSSTGLPNDIIAVSISNDSLANTANNTVVENAMQTIVLKTSSGYFQSDEHLMQWQNIMPLVEPKWLSNEELTQQDIDSANLRYKSQFLTLERIILDAHSGRIMGDFGVYFMDLVAMMLILLSLRGVYIWLRYARSKR